MSIKSILDSLTPQQRRQLMHAFENDFGQYIELSNKHFIGVNVNRIPNLEIEHEAGVWATGKIITQEPDKCES